MTRLASSACLLVALFLCLSPKLQAQAPAPVRSLDGVWDSGTPTFRLDPFPQMTPLGQQLFEEHMPFQGNRAVPVAESNDGFRYCDPLGVPRSVFYELRGVAYFEVTNRMLILNQYMRIWREIWTDARPLPTNVGTYEDGAADTRYFGYSVGRWEDDYTFVVHSTGFDEKIWADQRGYPISTNAMIEERYRRIDHDTLEITVIVDDPAMYTVSPFEAMREILTWDPDQEFEEQLCIPSEAMEYIETFRPLR